MLEVRHHFPLLKNFPELVYLDSSTTTQRPDSVIEAVSDFYSHKNANIGRGNYRLAEQADILLSEIRTKVAKFVGAHSSEIIFTANVTESLNIVAYAMLNASLPSANRVSSTPGPFSFGPGDEIAVTRAEHHANLVPWLKLAQKTGATLRVIDIEPDGRISLDNAAEVINAQTKLVAFTHVSNVTGAVTDVKTIVELAQAVGALTVLDACQSVAHMRVNFHDFGVDFAGFSAHKMFAGFGTGVLYIRQALLDQLEPVFYGGGIIHDVDFEQVSFIAGPERFETGTRNFDSIYSFSAAIDFIEQITFEAIDAHETELTESLLEIQSIPGVRILGPENSEQRIGVVAFTLEGVHPHDLAQYFDAHNFALRAGHHCTKALHRAFNAPASLRASVSIYNSLSEIERFKALLAEAHSYFRGCADD